jgi:predicted RNA methylase
MVLRIKSSATPVSSANLQGLQAMSVNEIKNYVANILTVSFGANADGTGTGEINITTNNAGSGTAIGSFVDTDRQEATGTHPATGAVDTVTYYAKQVTAAATESITNRPLKFDSGIKEMTDAQIDTELLDYAISAMVAETSYTAGQYRLQATAPSGGTWVSRYTLTDVANGGNTTTYLWQKTAATSTPDTSLKPLKLINTKDIKEMSSGEILQLRGSYMFQRQNQ